MLFLVLAARLWVHTQATLDPVESLFKQFYLSTESIGDHPQKALPELQRIQTKLKVLPSPSLAAADLWHDLGLFYYGDLANYNQALRCFSLAHSIRKKNLPDPAHNDLARSAFMIGVCHKYLGHYNAALAQVNAALKISSKGQNYFMLAKEYLELGDIYDYLGDYDQSITYYDRAYPHMLNSPRDRAILLEDLYKRLAQTYLVKEEHPLALAKNRLAIRVCIDSMNTDVADHFNAEIADCYTNMNLSYRALQRYDSAYWCLQQAQRYYQQSNLGDVALQIGNVYNELGELYLAQKRYPEALQNQQKAIGVLQNHPQHRYLSSAYASAGEAHLQAGNQSIASTFFRQALRIVVPKFPNSVQQITTVTDKCLIALHGLARCQIAQHQYPLALYNFRCLDTLITQLRSSLREDGSKFSLAQQALPIYENAIHTALLLNDTIAALNFCERNKAVVLRQALQDQSAKQSAQIAPESFARENTLRQRLVFWQKKVLETESDSLRGIWQDSLARVQISFERFIQSLEKKQPEYHRLKYAQIRAKSIVEIQGTLPDSTLCVEYFMGTTQLFVFAISKTDCRVFSQTLRPGFMDSLGLLIKNLRHTAPDDLALRYISAASFSAYQTLLNPALAALNTKNQIRRLRIVPDGLLHYLPFDALLEAPSPDLKAHDAAYLIKKFAIGYSFSNQLLDKKLNPKLRARLRFGGFGIGYTNVETKLAKLPLAEAQVDYLQHKIGGKTWTQHNRQATKENFMTHAPQCRILHLSMHGNIDEKQPAKSALMFVKNNAIEPLSAVEIYGMRFQHNELTVLSACNTGNGQLQRGEGIMSLSRAFTYAGCRSLVMSLWTLQDVYSDDIVKSFYAELKKGKPKDIALQSAKLHYLSQDGSERRVPNYWAAMVVIGDVEPIVLNRFSLIYFYAGITLLIVMALGVFKFRNKLF